jgi:sugar (pentulose or hexulose) kinase
VAEWSKTYESLYPRYRGLYKALKPTYDNLGS